MRVDYFAPRKRNIELLGLLSDMILVMSRVAKFPNASGRFKAYVLSKQAELDEPRLPSLLDLAIHRRLL